VAALFLRCDEVNGAEWQLWPAMQPLPPGAVQETKKYLFELRDSGAAATAELLVDEMPLEALRTRVASQARWRWSPGFHAGTVEIELRLTGSIPHRFELVTDPDLRKLTRTDFDTMVREILDDTYSLFSLSSFRKGIARGSGTRPPPIARLEFLRSRVEELEFAIGKILDNPRLVLTARENALPYHRATRATGPDILRSLRSGRVLREAPGPTRIPAALRGYLPEHIRIRQRRTSLDLPEHRQIGACLRSWSAWLNQVSSALERGLPADDEKRRGAKIWAARCRGLARRITVLSQAAPFQECGDTAPHLSLSALFINDPAYQRFYRLWRDMNRGIAAIFGDFLDLPLARTFELYELWCFLRLVRAGVQMFGPANVNVRELFTSEGAAGLTLAKGSLTVEVGSGWKLCFQKEYKQFWLPDRNPGSYSRDLKPDVVAGRSTPGGGRESRIIVLDAKYRISDALPEALSSIHTYRDALVHDAGTGAPQGIVRAAYLLTPHQPVLGPSYRDRNMGMPDLLFHPEYRSTFRFGAVSLRPGMDMSAVSNALGLIIADARADGVT